MTSKVARIVFLLAASLAAATAMADYLAADPGTHISIHFNSSNVIVVRPVDGVWSHPLCPDVTAAVLSAAFFVQDLKKPENFEPVRDWLMQAALNARSVNLEVSDTECAKNGYPLILSLRIFP